jgi:hypothetical protein
VDFSRRRSNHSWPYGTDPLPSPAEALAEPFVAFPSWFLKINLRPLRPGPAGCEPRAGAPARHGDPSASKEAVT